MLDKLHKRDRRTREKEIAENAKEASKGGSGHAAPCHEAKSGLEATNPRDAADLAVKAWARIGRTHVKELQEADRPWEVPDLEETSELPLLTVDGLPKTGIGVDAIHPSMWSRIPEKGKQRYTDLLNDVQRTLTWPAQVPTLSHSLVPKAPTGDRPNGLMPSTVCVGTYAQASPFWNNG